MGCFRNVGIGTGIAKDLKILVFVFGIVKGHFKVLVLGIVLRTFMNIGIGWKYWVLVLEKKWYCSGLLPINYGLALLY